MPGVEFRINTDSLTLLARRYRASPALVRKALVRSINRGGDAGTTQTRKDLVKATGIGASDTRRSKGLTKKLATERDQSFRLKARSSYTPLAYFKPQQTKAGVRASPWNRRQLFAGTFMVRMSSGYVGVFQRKRAEAIREVRTRAGRTIRARPIRELWGPSLAVEMMRNDIPDAFARIGRTKMAERLPHEIEHAFRNVGLGRKIRATA